ncbi:glyoxalase [Baekduia sp. Peel2402]|uniref:glyoxalase n=1 Tax=Baekduia sp. Peel2402 TaxID=3458296 RepID=UPI00403E6F23
MPSTITTTTIDHITLEVPDPAAAERFYEQAFGLGDRIRVRAADGASTSTGFRGFTLSLVVAGPSTVDGFVASAVSAGATVVKPAKKSLWGYGGVVQAPDGTLWKVATSSKKDDGTATRDVDDLVLLLGVADVKASKKFYVDQGLAVGKSFGSKYVEFEADEAPVKLALYGRKALAKDAGVDPEGSGAHRIAIASGEAFTDPDGFAWE